MDISISLLVIPYILLPELAGFGLGLLTKLGVSSCFQGHAYVTVVGCEFLRSLRGFLSEFSRLRIAHYCLCKPLLCLGGRPVVTVLENGLVVFIHAHVADSLYFHDPIHADGPRTDGSCEICFQCKIIRSMQFVNRD